MLMYHRSVSSLGSLFYSCSRFVLSFFFVTCILLAPSITASDTYLQKLFHKPITTIASTPGMIVDHLFFRSTIDDFGEQGNDVVRNALQQLNQLLTQQRTQGLAALSNVLQQNTELLAKQSDVFLNALQQEADGAIQQSTIAANSFLILGTFVLWRASWIAAMLLGGVIMIGFIVGALFISRIAIRRYVLLAAGAVLAIDIILSVLYAISYPSCFGSRTVAQDLLNGYNRASMQCRFDLARSYAKQLYSLGSPCDYVPSTPPELLIDKNDLLMKVLYRPWNYKDDERLTSLKAQIQSLQLRFTHATQAEDLDLSAATAMIYWITSDNRIGEYYAASVAASALDSFLSIEKSDAGHMRTRRRPSTQPVAFGLASLALEVLNNYLARPLTTAELEVAGLWSDESAPGLKMYSTSHLVQIQVAANGYRASHPNNELDILALHVFGKYETLANTLERSVLPAYVYMVHYGAFINVQHHPDYSNPNNTFALMERCAQRIIDAYDGSLDSQRAGFVSAMADPDFNGTPIAFASLNGLHAVYTRAVEYRAFNYARGQAPGLSLDDPLLSQMFAESPSLRIYNETTRTSLGSAVTPALQEQLETQYKIELKGLYDFECKYFAFIETRVGNTGTEEQREVEAKAFVEASTAGGALGLFVYSAPENTPVNDPATIFAPMSSGYRPLARTELSPSSSIAVGVVPFPEFMDNWLPWGRSMPSMPGLWEGVIERRRWIL